MCSQVTSQPDFLRDEKIERSLRIRYSEFLFVIVIFGG